MGFSRTSCELLLLALSVVTANASLQSLRDAASARGLLIGAATNVAQLANASEPMYRATEQV